MVGGETTEPVASEAGRRLQRLRRYGQTFGSRAACHLAPMDVTTDESHETSSPTVTELLITLCARNFVGVSGEATVSTETHLLVTAARELISQRTIFFSHIKPVSSTFSHGL